MGLPRGARLVLVATALTLACVNATITALDMDLGANPTGPLSGTYPVPSFVCSHEKKIPSPLENVSEDELVKGHKGLLGEEDYFKCLFSRYASLSMTSPNKIDTLKSIGPFVIPNFWSSVFVDPKEKSYSEIKDGLPGNFFQLSFMGDDGSKGIQGKWANPFLPNEVKDHYGRNLLNFVNPGADSVQTKLRVLESFFQFDMGEALSSKDNLGYYPLDYVKAYSGEDTELYRSLETRKGGATDIQSDEDSLPRRVSFSVRLEAEVCQVSVVVTKGYRVDMVKELVKTAIMESGDCRDVKMREVAKVHCDDSARESGGLFTGKTACVASLAYETGRGMSVEEESDGAGEKSSPSSIGSGKIAGVSGAESLGDSKGFSIDIEAPKEDISQYAYLISGQLQPASSSPSDGTPTSEDENEKHNEESDIGGSGGTGPRTVVHTHSDGDSSERESTESGSGNNGKGGGGGESVAKASQSIHEKGTVAKVRVQSTVQKELLAGWNQVLQEAKRHLLEPVHEDESDLEKGGHMVEPVVGNKGMGASHGDIGATTSTERALVEPVDSSRSKGSSPAASTRERDASFYDELNQALAKKPLAHLTKPPSHEPEGETTGEKSRALTRGGLDPGLEAEVHSKFAGGWASDLMEGREDRTDTDSSSGLRGMLPPAKAREVLAHGFDDY